MLADKAQVLGQHNRIRLVRNEEGQEFYWSTKSGKTAVNIRGLAKLIGCNPASVEIFTDKLTKLKSVKMYTTKGIRTVKLILEDEIPAVLDAMINGKRTAKKTKDGARKLQSALVQAGFRLMALLQVAPEQVAKEAIPFIKNEQAAKEVAESAEIHARYLATYKNIHDILHERGCDTSHHQAYNRQLNELVRLEPNNTRAKISDTTKRLLAAAQELGYVAVQYHPTARGIIALQHANAVAIKALYVAFLESIVTVIARKNMQP